MRLLLLSLLFLTLPTPLIYTAPSQALYYSLDPASVREHLAYYRAYPDSAEGQRALQRAWELLSGSSVTQTEDLPALDDADLFSLIQLIQGEKSGDKRALSEETLEAIEVLASHLPNRSLKGYSAKSEEEVLALSNDEVDLARGLLLSQLGKEEEGVRRRYEATLDLMALQVRAYLSPQASPEEKIEALNRFIFYTLRFRFPPRSLYAKDIDTYTFLPSVLDSQEGVCLGVTTLYLCLAQRLDLALEIITPPGHIYLRYKKGEEEINIETTARGIHVPSEHYLGINTRALETRTLKEVIGMAHFNQASVYWQQEKYDLALAAYKKNLPYNPQHPLLIELTGLCHIAQGNEEEGRRLLKELAPEVPEYFVSASPTVQDFLEGKVDAEGIRAIFLHVDHTRESILHKQKALQNVLERFPGFRSGWFHLGITWLQLHRQGEALESFQRLHTLDPSDPTVEYYLSSLYLQRQHFNRAWVHFRQSQALCAARSHSPKALKELKRALVRSCPENLGKVAQPG